jgi:hypothetical protein
VSKAQGHVTGAVTRARKKAKKVEMLTGLPFKYEEGIEGFEENQRNREIYPRT